MMPRTYTPLIIAFIVLLVVAIVSITWLNKYQRKNKNRYYEKKGVWLYALVSFLVFGLLGLFALGDLNQLRNMFWLFQVLILAAGVVHAWLVFQLFDWVDRTSFLPELLLTLFVGSVCTIAGMGSFWVFDTFVNERSEGAILTLSLAFLCFPIPFLILRTYDFWLQIPEAIFHAWRYPSYDTPNFRVVNYIKVHVVVARSLETHTKPDIEVESYLPRSVRLGDFFHRFIDKYNKENPQAPILHYTEDGSSHPVGWVFKLRSPQAGGKRVLDPLEMGLQGVQAGDTLFVERVRLDPDTPEPEEYTYANQSDDLFGGDDLLGGGSDDDLFKGKTGGDDFGIEFTEK